MYTTKTDGIYPYCTGIRRISDKTRTSDTARGKEGSFFFPVGYTNYFHRFRPRTGIRNIQDTNNIVVKKRWRKKKYDFYCYRYGCSGLHSDVVLLSGPGGRAVFQLLSGRRRRVFAAGGGGRRRRSGGGVLLLVVFGRLGRRSGRFRTGVGGRLAPERFQPAEPLGVRLLRPGAHLRRLFLFAVHAALLRPSGGAAAAAAAVVRRRRRRLLRRDAVALGRQQLMLGHVFALQLLQLRLHHGQLVQVALDHRQTGRQPFAVRVAAAAGHGQRRIRRRPRLAGVRGGSGRPVFDLHVGHHPEPALLHRYGGGRNGGGQHGRRLAVTGLQLSVISGRPLQRVLELFGRELGPRRRLPHVVPRAHRQLEPRLHDGLFAPQPY